MARRPDAATGRAHQGRGGRHQREAIALQQLLDDLLFLARSDELQHRELDRSTDLDDIVLREAQNQRATATSIEINTASVSVAHLVGDPGQLARVVRNLIGNAVRHAETTVDIVERHGGWVGYDDSWTTGARFVVTLPDSPTSGAGLRGAGGHRRARRDPSSPPPARPVGR